MCICQCFEQAEEQNFLTLCFYFEVFSFWVLSAEPGGCIIFGSQWYALLFFVRPLTTYQGVILYVFENNLEHHLGEEQCKTRNYGSHLHELDFGYQLALIS